LIRTLTNRLRVNLAGKFAVMPGNVSLGMTLKDLSSRTTK
jgi:hypothetical protein